MTNRGTEGRITYCFTRGSAPGIRSTKVSPIYSWGTIWLKFEKVILSIAAWQETQLWASETQPRTSTKSNSISASPERSPMRGQILSNKDFVFVDCNTHINMELSTRYDQRQGTTNCLNLQNWVLWKQEMTCENTYLSLRDIVCRAMASVRQKSQAVGSCAIWVL